MSSSLECDCCSERKHLQSSTGGFIDILENENIVRKAIPGSSENEFPLEAQISLLLKHPFIVKTLSVTRDDNWVYITTEYCRNKTLRAFLSDQTNNENLSMDDRLNIICSIGLAIAHMHSMDICHGDIKLDNILMHHTRTVRVCDFGCAHYIKDGETSRTYVGTQGYIAPEILQNHPHSKKCDMFSFGIVCFLVLNYIHPFDVGDKKRTRRRIIQGSHRVLELPGYKDVAVAVTQLLNPNPDERPTILEFLGNECFYPTIMRVMGNNLGFFEHEPIYEYFLALMDRGYAQ